VTEGCSKSGRKNTKNTAKVRIVLFPIFHIACCSCSLPYMTGDKEGLFLIAKNVFFAAKKKFFNKNSKLTPVFEKIF